MSFLSSMFGSSTGSGFQAQSAPVIDPLTGQAQTSTTAAQGAIGQQQQLANALQAQNGIANQSAVYGQLGNIASGTGPNPAASMLSQQTGQNVANTASLMAGQRGASQNAGLIARQAGMQGAATQQQAVGQGATMQAQQSLNALGQQAGIAGQQVGNQIGAQQALTAAQQAQTGQLIGANVAQNQANIANTQQQNQYNAAIAGGNQQAQSNIFSGITGAVGGAAALAHGGFVHHYASGGGVTDFSNMYGSSSGTTPMSAFGKSLSGSNAASFQAGQGVGQGINRGARALGSLFTSSPTPGDTSPEVQAATPTATPAPANTSVPMNVANTTGGAAPYGSTSADFAHGGKVPAMVSPGEKYLPPSEVKKVEKGEKSAIQAGKTIHGKAKVSGDSLKNDTVPKTLTEGGIVLPRSITQSKTPGRDAQRFVEALLAKQGSKGKRAA